MNRIYFLLTALLLFACNNNQLAYDASGTFEADEVIVAAELSGRILEMNLQEGDTLQKGSVAAVIDASNLALQKEQVEASINALHERTADVKPSIRLLQEQLAVQQAQLATLEREKQRTENLVKADAATPKQLDDIVAQIEVLKKQQAVTQQQIAVQKTTVATQNRTVLSEKPSLQKRAAQIEDQLKRSQVINPVTGTVLTKYAEAGEVTSAGKALYKIADLSVITLRAYITGTQLPQVKLKQPVSVLVDSGSKTYKKIGRAHV
jgi:HlyD family secretion protein